MTRLEAQLRLSIYLHKHFIYFKTDFYERTPRYTMIFKNCENSPDKMLESCVYFYQDCMEVKSYFNQNAASWCEKYRQNLPVIMQLFNYINATVWGCSADSAGGKLYDQNILYTPRIFMTEDECFDITITTVINYNFYEVAPVETEDYITAYCPDLLDKLSVAIFPLLFGKINLQQAMEYISRL